MRMLDRQIAIFLGAPAVPAAFSADSLADVRAGMRRAAASLSAPRVASICDLDASGVSVRLYRPDGREPRPLLVFLHGGGWLLGDLDTHDAMSRILADRAGCAVLAIDYRLAPEHPFPAGLDDVETAWGWTQKHAADLGCDPNRIAIGGESAGANLAAALTLRLRAEAREQPAFQLLIHPPTDLRFALPSFNEVEVPGLDPAFLAQCAALYKGQAEVTEPLVSPLCAGDFAGLPPAVVLTAEVDPLRDDGEYYARALAAAGVETLCRRLRGLPHGFMFLPISIPAVSEAFDMLAELIRRYFAMR